MHGNVWEWCEDWYHDNYNGAPADGRAWESPSGEYRVLRGGSFDSVRNCRSTIRFWYVPGGRNNVIGLRLSSSP